MQSIKKSRFIKFAVVGFSGTIVDIGISNFLRFIFNMPEIPAISISFILAVLNNFHWNRVWTYPELRNSEPRKRFVKFAIISIAGYLIRTPIFSLLEKPIFGFLEKSSFYIFSISPAIIAHNLTLGIVIIIVLFWNYFANRIWTYKSLSEGDLHEVDLS